MLNCLFMNAYFVVIGCFIKVPILRSHAPLPLPALIDFQQSFWKPCLVHGEALLLTKHTELQLLQLKVLDRLEHWRLKYDLVCFTAEHQMFNSTETFKTMALFPLISTPSNINQCVKFIFDEQGCILFQWCLANGGELTMQECGSRSTCLWESIRGEA